MDISVTIPVYNNSETLAALFDRLERVLVSAPLEGCRKEIVIVDDGSADRSSEVIRDYWTGRKSDIAIRHICLTRNFGQVSAILCGIKYAKGDCVASLSADLQDPPELIAEMFRGWQANIPINLGYRKIRADGWLNRFFSRLFYTVVRRYYPQLPIGGFDYVLLDRKVINNLLAIKYRNRFLQGDIISQGYPIRWYHYTRDLPANREHRVFNPFKISYFVDSIFHTKFIISFLFLESLAIILAGLSTIALHILSDSYSTGILGLVVLLFGVVNMSFTAVAAYLWRIYNASKTYPDYIVANIEDL